ncbi:glycoside hydrolase family 43 protein [Candidatus Sumerlaeota bacterium]|nr:glycoside hydrolase family 43 protein [Candidatus Sumerlaeota bacterium]
MPYTNPIVPGFHPDPSVCRVGEDYFLVTSTFEYFPGVPIYHSRDLIHWRAIGHCLTRPSQLPLEGAPSSRGVYAPTIRFHKDVFYTTTTNTSGGGNFFVTASDPAGEWSEPIWVDQKGIDPSLLFDDDGKIYYTTNRNKQSEIDVRTGKRLTEVRQTWPGTGGGWMEAPHLYKIDGLYYLLVAEGGTSRGHMVCVARSKDPWGPFESHPDNPILSNRRLPGPLQATGHADLFQAHDGSWWMVFLAIRDIPSGFPHMHLLGRETCLAPIDWKDGWPVVRGGDTIGLEVDAAPPGPLCPWPVAPTRDDFDSPRLDLSWVSLRNPNPADRSLTERPGYLRLHGSAVTLDDVASPAFVCRRQQHFRFRAATLLDFIPREENEEAGLTVFANEKHHYEIALARIEGKRHAIVRRRIGDLTAIVAREAVGEEGPVRLEMSGDETLYRFSCCLPGEREPRVLATAMTRYLTTEVAGGFTGAMIGLYATGRGRPCDAPADFDWFDYAGENESSG